MSGFEAVFAIAGLLAAAYLIIGSVAERIASKGIELVQVQERVIEDGKQKKKI